ncbi:alkane 1-monooxygenase [Hymenobacter daecheongensis DSM 21074]|uniref:Alkane 1-monooxygenase n=1 Tax=Hymenobacter daecheongensis DSM 21074 TaxID=1121955 RepID=A0A1M6GQW7_9BACT|nr:alkane 1-monooxygenase [Hymenobacter daecheongensis]SHJ12290.1 alkane 1-monooxygenase [Hymenobacter daecheongensis DSM 21074]
MASVLRDLRYLLAYTVPLTALAGFWWGGAWAWLTPAYVFGLIPLLEWLFPPRPASAEDEAPRLRRGFFDGLLYLNVGLQYGLLGIFLYVFTHSERTDWEYGGMVFSMGICCGALGINVAHELGHRVSATERTLAHLLLLSTLYLHFYIEHNRGHHRHVATPLDPATARFNEPFFRFLVRAVAGEYRGAWHLEAARLRQQGRAWWSGHNQMLRFQLYQLLLMLAVGAVFGLAGLLGWLGACAVGIILFQLVNYVEHYGLLRRRTATGIYERVQPWHSWNSEHAFGRILLYELTRHSDHHYQASRPYQTLRLQPQSPQMPTGYPGMMLLATLPPLWFQVMNKRVPNSEIVRW